MRIAHLADLHFHRDRYDECAASIKAVIAEHNRSPFDLIAIAGDTWDGPVQNTAGARFADFLRLIAMLAECAPVVMIVGTPSHDTEGSLEVFEQIQAAHKITILRPGLPYGLYTEDSYEPYVRELNKDKGYMLPQALLFGVPEPNKKWLLANAGAIGKDEADEIARSAMRGLFLGLGGIRKEHADLPCILLYHGQVSGAKTATGYEASSGLMASKDDLAAVGADYIALGDIHEPQQIGDLPAYYPGSIYPLNWGETHKAGCNVVEIKHRDGVKGQSPLFDEPEGWAADVSRLDFPHPQRHKISATFSGSSDIPVPRGRMVWIEITCTKEEAVDLHTEVVENYLLLGGALPGSRVTLNVLPTETVRAGDIAEKKTLGEKVQVYADNSSLVATEAILSKADEIEREATLDSAAGSGAHLRIDRLRLRGAIGIYKKSRKDEIDLDLEALGPGVLAFASPNGAGKTTILENMHPWPCMLTRDGTLKDHFRLKDSCRDLYLTDERTGWRYRAFISIRADIASGAAEYFLYCDKGQGFEPLPGINGRLDPYKEAVAQVFGSLEMYLRTAFVSQRPSKYAPDLSEATQGQRKALFAELSGTDYLEDYKTMAKAKADGIDRETLELRALIQATEGLAEEIENHRASVLSATADASDAEKRAQVCQDTIKGLEAQRQAIAQAVSELENKATRRASLEREIADLLREVGAAEQEAEGFSIAAKGKGAAEAELAKYEALEAQAATLRAEKAKVDAANHAALIEHQGKVREVDARRRTAQTALDEARRKAASVEQSLAVAKAGLAAPVQDHCPTCAQLLPAEKREHLQAERIKLEAQIVELDTAATLADRNAKALYDALAKITPPEAPQPLPFDSTEMLHALERDLDWFSPADLRATIAKANEAAVRIEGAERRAEDARSNAASKRLEADRLATETSGLPVEKQALADKDAKLLAELAAQMAAREDAATARATIAAEEKALSMAQARKSARDAAVKKIADLSGELADWRFLERACGPDGIQALELDALAPGIAYVANRLLTASGNTGRIEFRTTRMSSGSAKRSKQIEDFLVFYIDEAGEEQEIATLSGGESVWIRKALYDAFAVIRAQNTGVQFLTVFLDEADGALDPESRMRYLRMLEAAHVEAKRYQTIIVTHSTELQAMVDRTINVADLGPRG